MRRARQRASRAAFRLQIAALVALVETAVLVLLSVPASVAIAAAVVVAAIHFALRRRLPVNVRRATWTLAVAQALVAVFVSAIGASLYVLAIVLVLAGLIAVMVLLGNATDRRA